MSDRYGYIAIETLLKYCENSADHAVTPNDFMRMARVRVPERKTGKWIERWHENKHVIGDMACSVCGAQMLLTYPRFCPYCGAEMRGGQ